MAQQEQQRINQAADEFTDAIVGSYRAISERGVSAQEHNAQLTKDFFDRVVNNLQAQTEDNQQMTHQLADHKLRAEEAKRTLTRESVGAYMNWVNSAISAAQGGVQQQKQGAREAEKAAKGKKS